MENATYNNVLLVVAFLMMIFIFINELKNMSLFIYKYNSIRDMAKVNMDHYCNGVYCEAETDRFQLAKHIYDLVLPNDVYNAKTYTILVLIYTIILFIVAYNLLIKWFKDNSLELTWLFHTVFAIFFVIFVILNIASRYIPYDEKGYLNYFKTNKDDITLDSRAINGSMYGILVFGLILYIGYNVFIIKNISDTSKKVNLAYMCGYFIFCFYLMFNMINIVEAFKENKIPHDIYDEATQKQDYEDNWSADISHASENYFYHQYFNLKNIPLFGLDLHDYKDGTVFAGNFVYDLHDNYFSTMHLTVILFFTVFVILFLIGSLYLFGLVDKSNMETYYNNYIVQILPLLILFVIMLFITNFMTFNTGFNKYVLYGAHGSCYKQALNQMNNVLVPYIAMHENYTGAGISTQRNYLYHYIVLNVLVSYLKNYITLANQGAQDIDIAGYKSTADMKTLKIKFNKIEANDISDLHKFEAYYKGLMRKVLKYELDNIPTNLKIQDIKGRYIDGILNKIFTSTTPSFTYSSKSTDVSTYKTNIKDAVYYCIYLLNIKNFNTKIEEYNKDPTSLTNNLYFYIEKDLTSHPYKFLLKPSDVTNFKNNNKAYYDTNNTDNVLKVLDATMVNPIIELFLEHINSLYSDVKNNPNGFENKNTEAEKLSVFNGNIYTSLTMLSSTKGNKPLPTDRNSVFNTTEKLTLKYLYHEMLKTMKVPLETNNNYLKNAIENMYYQLNKENATVKLYDVDVVDKSLKIDKNTDNANLQNAKYLKAWNKEHDNTKIDDINNILHNANKYASVNFFFAYAVNIVILFIMYYAIVQKNK